MIAVYREFRPGPALLPFVECGWVRSASTVPSMRVMPDGCVDLFVTAEGDVMIAGPATTSYQMSGGSLAGLRLRPGAASAVIGAPANEFRDIRIPIDSVLGVPAGWITEIFCSTTIPSQRMILLQGMLTSHVTGVDPSVDRPVARVIEMLRVRPDRPVSALADAVGFTERQLRRRIQAAVGYGPKRLGRIFRFQHLLDLIHAAGGSVRWAEIAVAAGYSDQSHMVNECVALAGVTPTALPGGGLGEMSVSSNTAKDGSP